MTMEMKIEIIKREIIKPSSPNPHNKKNFNLSFLDQPAPVGYAPLRLFYTKDTDNNQHAKAAQRSHRLKTSLCKILSHFYPLAGRIKDSATIECNDDGVEYVEARVNCLLLDTLKQPDGEVLKLFLSGARTSGFLLLVQLTFFKCGGMVIGLCISHKLADAASLTTFIKGWAAMALESGEATIPEFNAVSLFPPRDSSVLNTAGKLMKPQGNVRKRFVFDGSKLDALKAKAASASVQQPTRVEAVLTLIWKCAMTASRSNSGFPSKPSVLTQIVNLRKRIVAPLPESSIGNFVGYYAAQYEESEVELHNLVCQLRRGLEDFSENYAKRLLVDNTSSVILESLKVVENMNKRNEDIESYLCTSWCRFPLYEADFGWGKPTWVSIAGAPYKNFVWLVDARSGDGIEAWVSLSEEDMALFERDEKLLAFAYLNPSVL